MLPVRIILSILAVFAPFFFPWAYALGIAVLAAIFFPPIALVTGGLLDALYYTGTGFPYFTIVGIAITGIAWVVQYILRTRIMS